MVLNCGVGEDSWESLGLQGDPTSPSERKSVLNIHWKDWCRSSSTLATWCEELTYLKRPWCWESLKAEGEGNNREWDSWMASLTRWTWVWANSRSWWWIGKPYMLQRMGLQRVGCNWTEDNIKFLEKELGFGEKSRNCGGPYGGSWPSKKSSRDHSPWVVFYCITLYILYYISFLEFCL